MPASILCSVVKVDNKSKANENLKLLIQKVAIETAAKIGQEQSSSDPLADLELLQRLADHGWLIPTSRLAAIVGLSPSTLSGRKEFNYSGFTISKAGKQGNQTAWKVSLGRY